MKKSVGSQKKSADNIKMLTPEQAFQEYKKLGKIRFSVSEKFMKDHVIDPINNKQPLSKSGAIAGAIKRYEEKETLTSSWLVITKHELIRLVDTALDQHKRAKIQKGKQQLTTEITVTRRRINITASSAKSKDVLQAKDIIIVGSKREQKALSIENTTDETIKVRVVGDWSPGECSAEIYHYEEKDMLPMNHEFLDFYLRFNHNGKTPTRPSLRNPGERLGHEKKK